MSDVVIDEMIEFALAELLSGSDARRRAMVRRMCELWPETPAMAVVFAITSAAGMIEDNLVPSPAKPEIGPFAWRLAALVAADVYAAESLARRRAKAGDLLHFWRRVDIDHLSP